MPLYGEEVSWSNAIKSPSAELACNLVVQVWTWRSKGKGAAAPTLAYCLSDTMCTSVELQQIWSIGSVHEYFRKISFSQNVLPMWWWSSVKDNPNTLEKMCKFVTGYLSPSVDVSVAREWFWLRLALMFVIGHPWTKWRLACGIRLGVVGARALSARVCKAFCFLGHGAVLGLACASISSLSGPLVWWGKKASWLPAECRSTQCGFNQEQGWESLLGLDVELIAHCLWWE